jgi:hypothetical protein
MLVRMLNKEVPGNQISDWNSYGESDKIGKDFE